MELSSKIIAFICSLFFAALFTPMVRKIAIAVNIVDNPGERRVHATPIPLLGGVAIFAAFVLSVLAFINPSLQIKGILVGGSVILILGIIDDALELSAKLKLIGQVIAAVILVGYDVKIEFVTNPFGPGMIYLGAWTIPVTILWVVALTNVVNFIDGLDGLAAGVSSIAAIVMSIVGAMKGQAEVSILAAALAGASIGFLRYNFNPARIFMGDTGAMFLGFTLAAISAIGAVKGAATIALTIPTLALGVPIADTAMAIIRRMRNGMPVYVADKGHLHHRLLALGLSQRQAVLTIYAVSLLLGMSAILVSRTSDLLSNLIIIAVCVVLFLMAKKSGVVEGSSEIRTHNSNVSRGV